MRRTDIVITFIVFLFFALVVDFNLLCEKGSFSLKLLIRYRSSNRFFAVSHTNQKDVYVV